MAYKTHIVCHSRSQSHLQEEVCSIQHKEMGSSIRECKRSSYNEHLVPPPSPPPPSMDCCFTLFERQGYRLDN